MNDPTSAAPTLALDVRGVSKQFGGTKALDDASLAVRPGTVHGLLGGNGSGKSTLIKILAGAYRADAGRVAVFGREVALRDFNAAAAAEAGLRFVHQDLGLFDDLSIEENFALDAGYPLNSARGVAWKELRAQVARVLEEYELDAEPRTPVRDLRASDRTMVAIARALQGDDGKRLILVLDEPTASLAAHESQGLLDRIRRRADKGQTVVIVSHRLREVLSVADDFTVLRDGVVQGTLRDEHPTEDDIVALMAGGLTVSLRPTGSQSHTTGRPMLEVEDLRSGPLEGVSLTVHEGEILGVAGLVGSGCSSLLQALFGAYRPHGGTMTLAGEEYAPESIGEAMDRGVAFVPEDRVHEAAFMDRSVRENIAIAMLKEYWTTKWMHRPREDRRASELIDRFHIKVDGPGSLFSSMSGGNQQKVVVARWLQREPRLLLLDEPTQGVDVMSRADIYATIRDSAKHGTAVIVASSDMSELHALCDRVVFLKQGRIEQEVFAGQLDVDGLTALVLREGPTPTPTTLERTATS
ncbi:sugar ABC transporter ATP-binding protein [Demequina pelophila]|uniref:sugar ABC transporter ATP-binding protein n=1 Tax=Demequina pelophila TaxID=1638984 RepID=UPI000785F207|nr:sugar ABC transporter ATP-binding protein [Demequina pelophila]